MIGDNDIQVWLDSQHNAGQLIMIPYVKTAREMQINYELTLVQNSSSGNSRVSQGGTVKTAVATAASLSRLTVVPKKQSECWVEVNLREGGQTLGDYRFDCPD